MAFHRGGINHAANVSRGGCDDILTVVISFADWEILHRGHSAFATTRHADVPRDIRQQLHLEEGQPLMARILDAHRLVIAIVPTLSPDELFAQYPLTKPVTNDWQPAMADAMAKHHHNCRMPEGYVETNVFLHA